MICWRTIWNFLISGQILLSGRGGGDFHTSCAKRAPAPSHGVRERSAVRPLYPAARTSEKEQASDNVVPLPKRPEAAAHAHDYSAIDSFAPAGSDLNTGLRQIHDADPSFDPRGFR